MTEEQWRPVVGYEGLYEVSDQGRVRRLSSGAIKASFDRWGYRKVALTMRGETKGKLIHVLVAEAFIGPRGKGKVVCHGPNGQDDNSLGNLYYSTQSENNKEDRRRDGTANMGEAHPCAKITEDIAIEILSLKGKMLQADIAAKFGVSQQTVSAIQVGRKWPHLQTKEGRAMAAHATRNATRKRHLSPFV
jgi:hypothetical protein